MRASLPLILLLAACTGGKGSTGDSAGPAADLPGLTLSVAISDVVPTVATATWSLDSADTAVDAAWIEFGRDGGFDTRVAVDLTEGPPYAMPLLGMKPDTTYGVRVVADTAAGTATSDAVDITTGPVSPALPGTTVELTDAAAMHKGFYVTSIVTGPTAVILDSDGDYVWWYTLEGVDRLGRARLSQDRKSVLMATINLDGDKDVDIVRVSVDGSTEEHISTPRRHHDFVELSDGTLVYAVEDPTQVNAGVTIAGDILVEHSPDGTIRQVYDVLDHHEPLSGSDSGGERWPHANAIDVVDDESAYLVSFLYMNGIARIERDTGDETWFLGGGESDFHRSDGSSDYTDYQHGIELLDDHLLIFDNGHSAHSSRAVEVAFDTDTMLAEQVWEYRPDPELDTVTMGDVHRFDDGNTLVTFSYNGVIEEVDSGGAALWKLSTEIGGAFSWLDYLDRLQPE